DNADAHYNLGILYEHLNRHPADGSVQESQAASSLASLNPNSVAAAMSAAATREEANGKMATTSSVSEAELRGVSERVSMEAFARVKAANLTPQLNRIAQAVVSATSQQPPKAVPPAQEPKEARHPDVAEIRKQHEALQATIRRRSESQT